MLLKTPKNTRLIKKGVAWFYYMIRNATYYEEFDLSMGFYILLLIYIENLTSELVTGYIRSIEQIREVFIILLITLK